MFAGKSQAGKEYSVSRERDSFCATIPGHKITGMKVSPGTSPSPQGPVEGLKGQARVNGKLTPVCIPWTAELRAWYDAELLLFQQEEQEAQRIAQDVPWPVFRWGLGCDAPSSCSLETYPELLKYREDWVEAQEFLRKANSTEIIEQCPTAQKQLGDLGTWFYLSIPGEEVRKMVERARTEATAVRNQVKILKADHEAKCFQIAQSTGEEVALRSWTEPCSSLHEECDLDHVTEWVRPDGTRSTTRTHTW